jgi:hypothetical protein
MELKRLLVLVGSGVKGKKGKRYDIAKQKTNSE